MAIAFVKNLGQAAAATQQAAPITLAGGVNTAQGNLVVVRCHSTGGNDVAVAGIEDSQGNLYYQAVPSSAAGATAEIWYAIMLVPLVAGNTITVTFTISAAGTAAAADEFSGVIARSPLDVTAEASSATTTVTVGATPAASVAGSLIVTCAGASTTGTWTYPGGAYTNFTVPGGTAVHQGAWQVAGGVGGFSATWVNASAASMEAVIAVFQPTPVAATKLFPVPAGVELLINGTWTDITGYVYQRDGISISGGKSDSTTATADPATCTFTVDNRDGRFSPNYTGGAYYPYLTRNIQCRVSVANAMSSSGNTYSGFRFWGKVTDWPPLQDISGHDVYSQVSATGPLRQIKQGSGKGSALTRYYQTLTGTYAPVAYWPCEEDPDTGQIGAGVQGGTNMDVTVGKPTWKAIEAFDGSIPVPIVNYSTWDGLTGQLGSSGNDVFSVPGTHTWFASTSTVDARVIAGGGGGENGLRGTGGGGGEFARESALAVTAGTAYTVVVGGGGAGGANTTNGTGRNGQAGGQSTIAGDSVTVVGHGGQGGTQDGGGAGGTGSANTAHFGGGHGGNNASDFNSGAGGGGSGGTASAGNAGGNATSGTFGAGGSAVSGGGAGGRGGTGGSIGISPAGGGFSGGSPGGGGGGGGNDPGDRSNNHSGGNGAPGQVQLIYTPATAPTTVVIRFIMMCPVHGANPGKVLLKAFTGSAVIDHVEVTYVTGGKLRLRGLNSSNVQQFDSTAQAWGLDGQPVMVSIELVNSGANIAWAFRAVKPGATTLVGSATGTVTTAAVGNVSEVIVSPNADISSTAIGHISVQYALIPLLNVSKALGGHLTEVSIDRFIRLANEEAIDNAIQFSETNDHWGFENGTQSWVATNGAVTSSNVTITGQWPTERTNSLLLTANGAGNPSASSPTGTSGEPVNVGDIVSVAADVMAPTALTKMFVGIKWWQAGGSACAHAEDDGTDTLLVANTGTTLTVSATAPATAAFFSVVFGDHNTDASNTLLYLDHVRVSPQMGKQTWKAYHAFLEEIEDLDQGILKEAKILHGLGYRTRIAMMNQTPSVTLDFSKGTISPPFAPVFDDQNIKNDITVKRHHGSSIRVTSSGGALSIEEPPAGAGRFKKQLKVAAAADQQLAALAQHLLTLGTVSDERYPAITVNLARANIAGNTLAPLMSAVAGVEIGDYIQITNLPFWYPSSTAKQLVIGYTETINAYDWTITWNCVPESPWEIVATAVRRW